MSTQSATGPTDRLRRVGVIVPSSNTVMEPDLQRALRGVATVHTARMYLADPVTPDGELEMLEEAVPAARLLGTLEPDVVLFGCTSAGAICGAARDAELRYEMAGVADAPVLGVFDSMTRSLAAIGVTRVSVVTPYRDDLNAAIGRSLAEAGFEVLSIRGMGIANNVDTGRVEPERIVEFAVANVDGRAEALAIPCTNFRAYEVRGEIRRRLGIPVVTANSSIVDDVTAALAGDGSPHPTETETGNDADR